MLFWEILRLVNWKVWGTSNKFNNYFAAKEYFNTFCIYCNCFKINLLTLTREGYLVIIYYSSSSFSPQISKYFNTNKNCNVWATEPNSWCYWHIMLQFSGEKRDSKESKCKKMVIMQLGYCNQETAFLL